MDFLVRRRGVCHRRMSNNYAEAARVVKDVVERKRGLGSNFANSAVFALATETIRFHEVLEEVMCKAGVFADKESKKTDHHLLLVLCYEFLLGQSPGDIRGGGRAKAFVMKHKTRLTAELARLKVRRKAATNEDLLPETTQIASFARINRVLCQLPMAEVAAMVGSELKMSFGGPIDPGADWDKLITAQETHFFLDVHVPDLLVFGPKAELGRSGLVERGLLVLQQKSSCLPAYLACCDKLFRGGVDSCAAPGNKTAHLLALLGPQGRVWATEKDGQRVELLRQRMRQLGCAERVTCENVDFLTWQGPPKGAAQVAVVDPSCSGSGMVQRGGPQTLLPGRLEALAQFQTTAVRRAMAFPDVQRVVYSTCSVHEEENENVVRAVLASNPDFELAVALPQWPSRGRGDDCAACVRVEAAAHRTIGFFVAVFDRRQLASSSSSCHLVCKQAMTSSSSTGVEMLPVEDGEPQKKKKRRKKRKTLNTS